ncbi:hypothetical protein CEXT_403751 [Caerostris extrusa]|uniref:Transposase n=1 Tax=Caerostris extrusa TaxID=172846 RepID=A0AAV4NDU5_CAEEX|nr:hypothetical protein CEXT_403751 [Caerostris extrusa]
MGSSFVSKHNNVHQQVSRVHEAHQRMKIVCKELSLSLTRVQDWLKSFRQGRGSLKNDLRPGQSRLVITDALVNEVTRSS